MHTKITITIFNGNGVTEPPSYHSRWALEYLPLWLLQHLRPFFEFLDLKSVKQRLDSMPVAQLSTPEATLAAHLPSSASVSRQQGMRVNGTTHSII